MGRGVWRRPLRGAGTAPIGGTPATLPSTWPPPSAAEATRTVTCYGWGRWRGVHRGEAVRLRARGLGGITWGVAPCVGGWRNDDSVCCRRPVLLLLPPVATWRCG